MFISKADKQRIEAQLDTARHHIVLLESRIALLENGLKQLAIKPVKVKKPKKPLTAAQKAKQREYQRMYKARKKQEEQDWKLVQAIAGEGNTNVSA